MNMIDAVGITVMTCCFIGYFVNRHCYWSGHEVGRQTRYDEVVRVETKNTELICSLRRADGQLSANKEHFESNDEYAKLLRRKGQRCEETILAIHELLDSRLMEVEAEDEETEDDDN